MSLLNIKDLFHFEKGSLQSSKCTPGEFNFITAAADWKTHNEYSHDCEALIFAAAASGSLGRTHYVNGQFISSDLCFILTPKDPVKYPIDLKFYHLIFQAFKDEIVRNTKSGTSKEAIGLTVFGKYKLPYFDIEKQEEVKEQFVSAQESKIGLDSELTHKLDLVKQLRQAFLREAIQGKLVPQNANDEPASVLLEKIKAEKDRLIKEKIIRKGKLQEAEILDELLFDVPNHWVWCSLDEVTELITDGTHQTPKYTKSGVQFLSAQHVKPFRFMPDENKYVSYEAYKDCVRNKNPEVGDILVTRVGAIGEAAVIDQDLQFAFYVSLGLIKPIKRLTNSYYLQYVINSPYGNAYSKGNVSSKGSSAGNFNLGRIRSFLIPFPPLSEQQRIVAKLDELMQYCDDLEASIIESQQQNELLLQQVLRAALGPKEKEVV